MSFWNDLILSIRGNIRECMTTPLSKKKVLIFGGVVIIIILIIIIIAVSVRHSGGGSKPPPAKNGSDVIKNYPFIVGGNGMSEVIRTKLKNKINDQNLNAILSQVDISIEDLLNGDISTMIWDLGATNCNTSQYHDALSQTLDQIDMMKRLIHLNTNFSLVTYSEDITLAKNNRQIGCILRVNGGYTLDGKLSIIRTFYNLGVRILAVGGQCNNPWTNKTCSSATDKAADPEETFRQTIVKEMSRLGMIIDISGACKAAQLSFMDAAKTENISVLLSQDDSSDGTLDKDVVDKLKEIGGLLLMSLEKKNVCGTKEGDACDIKSIIKYLNEVRMKFGDSKNIGLGSNFGNKALTFPTDLDKPSKFPNLFDRLLKPLSNDSLKWVEEDLKNLAGGNFIKLFESAVQHAKGKETIKAFEETIDTSLMPPLTNSCYTEYL